MKKRKLLWLVVALCVLCTAGCSQQTESPADFSGGQSTGGNQAEGGFSGETTPMELVTPNKGLLYSSYSGNEQGTYYVDNTGKDFSGYLLYMDYASLQTVYLSPQLDVTFDEQNPGWIDYLGGGAFPIATDDALYVYLCGLPGTGSATYEEHPARLLKMQPNGADRQEIVFSGNYDVQLGSAVATDGDELYFLATRFKPQTGVIEATVLLKSDFRAGQMVEVCELGSGTDVLIVGACDEGMILQKIDDGSTCSFSVLTAAGEEKSVPLTWTAGESSRIVYDGKLVMCDAATGVLTAYDFASGQTSELLDLSGRLDPSSEAVYILTDEHDAHIVVGVFEIIEIGETGHIGAELKRLCVDLETGEVKDFTLTGELFGEVQYIPIYCETEDDYLVAYTSHRADVIAYAPGGSEYIDNIPVADFALIDKDDYWNSVPNYRPIAELENDIRRA